MKRIYHWLKRHLLDSYRRFGFKIYSIVLIVGLLVGLGLAFYPDKPPLPSSVKNQVTSTILVPHARGYRIDRQSARYDATRQLLTFTVSFNATTATVSEQPAPSQFSDISNYYPQFAQGLHAYDGFDSTFGHVYLIRPSGPSSQAVVLYAAGTLLFVRPTTPQNLVTWQKFFRSMAVIR